MLYQNIPIGTSGLAVAQAAAKSGSGLELTPLEATVELPTIAAAAEKLKASGVQAALVLGAPRFAVDGIAALRKAGSTKS